MPTGPETLLAHLTRLERELGELRSQVVRGVARDSHVGDRRNPRLAVTVKAYGVPYPVIDDEPDTYWIRFLDTSFPRAQGKQGNTQQERQTAGNEFTLAQNTMGGTRDAYVPEGSLIEVLADRTPTGTMQWWFTRIDPDQDDSSGDLTIDVLICEPWNRCTEYLVFPQRRIHLPPGSSITTLPNSVVPLNICESSQDPPPSSQNDPPSDSEGDSSSGPLGEGWTDGDITWLKMIVSGDLTPPGATGEYSVGAGYFNGRPFWYRFSMGGTYMIWWNPGGDWVLSKLGDTTNYWYKKDSPDTVQGDYMASAAATGVATVVQGGLP